ncbi:MAG: glycosyltransferase family 2 protein [Hyphomicrobium sp.]
MRMLGPVEVSILIVSYNTNSLTVGALSSILSEAKDLAYETIVVDNASTDGSPEMIAAHPLKPRLIRLKDNIGFARATNMAAREARGRYLLLLNPDTVVLDHAIDRLVEFARQRPEARIWGGRTLFVDGRLNPASCWKRMTLWGLFCRASGLAAIFPGSELFNREGMGGWRRDTVRNVDIVSGCFFLIETSLWRGLRGFDPHFFMYGEDADLCLRAHAFSARPIMTPSATIVHYGGASEPVRAEKMVRLLAAKSSLIARHWRPWLVPLGRALLASWPLSRVIATTAAAAIVPTPAMTEPSKTWRQVYTRRSEWRSGYDAYRAEAVWHAEALPSIPKSVA